MTGTYAPVSEAERVDVLDALRAFALLGIFISHVPEFSGFDFMTDAEQAARDVLGANAPLDAFQDFFIRGKFFSLFSLLFGIGFAVQLDSARHRGADFARHFARRLFVLFAMGALHALVWYGDILKDYALIGLLLIVTARWKPKTTLYAALAVLALRALWPIMMWVVVARATPLEAGANPAGDFFALTQTFSGTDLSAIFAANGELLRLKALQMIYDGKAISILGMFLLGAYIGRRRIYRELAANTPFLHRVLLICAPIGIIGNAFMTYTDTLATRYPPTALWTIGQIVFAVAVPAMTLAYACGFALLWQTALRRPLRMLAPAGRMALTTYVSQTLIGILFFYGVGAGLRGSVGLAECMLFAVTVFALQCALAAGWFEVFRFGPLEWLWRRATYGTPLPMLKQSHVLT